MNKSHKKTDLKVDKTVKHSTHCGRFCSSPSVNKSHAHVKEASSSKVKIASEQISKRFGRALTRLSDK
jgi:hypothetical protein